MKRVLFSAFFYLVGWFVWAAIGAYGYGPPPPADDPIFVLAGKYGHALSLAFAVIGVLICALEERGRAT
jgi:hypothetical protein